MIATAITTMITIVIINIIATATIRMIAATIKVTA